MLSLGEIGKHSAVLRVQRCLGGESFAKYSKLEARPACPAREVSASLNNTNGRFVATCFYSQYFHTARYSIAEREKRKRLRFRFRAKTCYMKAFI